MRSYAIYPEMAHPDFSKALPADFSFARLDPDEAASHESLVELLRSPGVDFRPWLSARYPPDDFQEAWEAAQCTKCLKVAVQFEGDYSELL